MPKALLSSLSDDDDYIHEIIELGTVISEMRVPVFRKWTLAEALMGELGPSTQALVVQRRFLLVGQVDEIFIYIEEGK